MAFSAHCAAAAATGSDPPLPDMLKEHQRSIATMLSDLQEILMSRIDRLPAEICSHLEARIHAGPEQQFTPQPLRPEVLKEPLHVRAGSGPSDEETASDDSVVDPDDTDVCTEPEVVDLALVTQAEIDATDTAESDSVQDFNPAAAVPYEQCSSCLTRESPEWYRGWGPYEESLYCASCWEDWQVEASEERAREEVPECLSEPIQAAWCTLGPRVRNIILKHCPEYSDDLPPAVAEVQWSDEELLSFFFSNGEIAPPYRRRHRLPPVRSVAEPPSAPEAAASAETVAADLVTQLDRRLYPPAASSLPTPSVPSGSGSGSGSARPHEMSVRDFITAARPQWCKQVVKEVVRKLQQVGVSSLPTLFELLSAGRRNTLNRRLKQQGQQQFGRETLEAFALEKARQERLAGYPTDSEDEVMDPPERSRWKATRMRALVTNWARGASGVDGTKVPRVSQIIGSGSDFEAD